MTVLEFSIGFILLYVAAQGMVDLYTAEKSRMRPTFSDKMKLHMS